MGEKGLVDLVAVELGGAVGGFLFFPHADPDVGVENVGTFGGFGGVGGGANVASGFADEAGGWLKFFRGGEAEFDVEFGRGPDPGAGDIAIGIADEANFQSVEATAFFLDGLQVGEDLAGVLLVGEGIDRGNAAESGEVFDF